jgi:hypothetical protein
VGVAVSLLRGPLRGLHGRVPLEPGPVWLWGAPRGAPRGAPEGAPKGRPRPPLRPRPAREATRGSGKECRADPMASLSISKLPRWSSLFERDQKLGWGEEGRPMSEAVLICYRKGGGCLNLARRLQAFMGQPRHTL